MRDNYRELAFRRIIADLLLRTWFLDNDITMNKKNKAGFTALINDYLYKMNIKNMAKQKSYDFEKNQRRHNKIFVKMKYYLDKHGWDEFIDGITMYY